MHGQTAPGIDALAKRLREMEDEIKKLKHRLALLSRDGGTPGPPGPPGGGSGSLTPPMRNVPDGPENAFLGFGEIVDIEGGSAPEIMWENTGVFNYIILHTADLNGNGEVDVWLDSGFFGIYRGFDTIMEVFADGLGGTGSVSLFNSPGGPLNPTVGSPGDTEQQQIDALYDFAETYLGLIDGR